MELTHRLTKNIYEYAQAEAGALRYRDGVFIEGAGGNGSSTPILLHNGETISFMSNCPAHEHPTAPIPYTDYGWQQLLICSNYAAGETYEALGVIEDDKTLVRYTATNDCYVVIGTKYTSDLQPIKVKIERTPIITIIQEPIGFDSLKVQINRHDYHGIGAESSIDALEFYGNAIDIISNAYAADIDSSIVYDVLNGSTAIYTGKLDLSTYKEMRGDYRSISCRVGEIGDMTTFNNRTDKDIDLDNPKTLDGDQVDAPEWMELHIPKKSLHYTNIMQEKTTRVIDSRESWGNGDSKPDDIEGNIVLSIPYVNEYGTILNEGILFSKNNGFDEKFGTGTTSHIEWNMSFRVSWDSIYSIGSYDVYGEVYLHSGSQLIGVARFDMLKYPGKSDTKELLVHYSADQFPNNPLRLSYRFWQIGDGNNNRTYNGLKLEILGGAELKMTMYDKLPDDGVSTKMMLVHDALNVVAHAISENELSVKSDWYRTPESHWNPGAIRTKANGGNGALKAITNGYHIRGLFTDGETQRNMPLSFKNLIESLDAMDCIGWGFSTEDNVLCLRVERWDWFYKDTVILTLDNVAEVTTEVYPDLIPTELKIGYKKFATQDQYNSIDSPHGTRTFVNGIKALSKSITKESEFIADNYAIEETRRARTQVNETEETTYDENIFVFELMRTERIVPVGGTPIPPPYSIVHSALYASNVGRAEEFINAKLTPRHMAARWRDFLFATNNSTDFRFISGEINYKSSFGTTPEDGVPILGAAYLTAFATRSPQAENDDITNIHAKFKAEKITFSYPISIEDYKTIKANPYGLVSVNGTLGWIMDFKYSLQDGMADFTLIAKYTN